jgi:hypothetical protein
MCGSAEGLYVEAKLEVGILKYASVDIQNHFAGVDWYS